MSMKGTLQLTDIPWLRLADRVAGTAEMPPAIASKLLAGGFIRQDERRGCLVTTERGKLALTRLT